MGDVCATWRLRTRVVTALLFVGLGAGCESEPGTADAPPMAPSPPAVGVGSPNSSAPAADVDGAAHVNRSGAPSAPLGVIVRLRGSSAFEAHAPLRARGRDVARAAVKLQRSTLHAQHGRILAALVPHVGDVTSRRGRGIVVGPSYDDFTDVLNGMAFYGVSLATATRALQNDADVIAIEPLVEVHATLTESVPLINADQVWTLSDMNGLGIDGGGTRIGIVDTGVDYTHPDLGGCFGAGCKVAGGYDFVNDDADPMDDMGHGTHVAATAAGDGTYAGPNGPLPIRGVAPGAEIYAYKVLGSDGYGSSADVIAGIERCADPNADGDPSDHLDVCNLSLGAAGTPDDAMSTAVDNATASGVVFAISAGNSGPAEATVRSPGTARRAITVAAACKPSSIGVDARCAGPIASFSSRGPVLWTDANGAETLAKPDIAAPGVSICAAEWGAYQSGSRCLDGRHIAISGTSMASPHVAGVAALLRQAHPEWAPDQVKHFIVASARDLGVEGDVEGAGRIDARDALALGGIPSSFAQIAGTPLRDFDTTSTRFGVFSSDLTVTNTSSESLVFAASFSGDSGLTATFTPESLSLDPGAAAKIRVTRQVDHVVVPSGANAHGIVRLGTARGELQIGLEIGVRARVAVKPAVVDMGVDLPSNVAWTAHASVELASLTTDVPTTYAVAVHCCDGPFQQGGASITGAPDRSSVTLGPGETASFDVTVQATNALLINGRFNGSVVLSSPIDTITIPLTFFKGYGVRIDTTPTLPYAIALSSTQASVTVATAPSTPSTMFVSTVPGPFFVEAMWQGPSPYTQTHVLVGDLATDAPIRVVALDKAQAIYDIDLQPTDQTGAPVAQTAGAYRFTHSASGGGLYVSIFGAGTKIRTSAIPAGVNFTASVFGYSPDPVAYLYELPGPVAADHAFTNTAADLVDKDVHLYRPMPGGETPFLQQEACLVLPYWTSASGTMVGGGIECTLGWPTFGVSLPSGRTTMRFYNSSARDLLTAPYPDAPAVLLGAYAGPGGKEVYRKLLTNVNAAHSYSWNTLWTDIDAVRPSEAYARYMCDEPPAGTLPIGPGPMIGQWSFYDHRMDVFRFQPTKGLYENVFAWGGCVQETDVTANPPSYRLFRDGTLVANGSIASYNRLDLPLARGRQRFELTRSVVIGGVDTNVQSISTFAVEWATSIDENPPRLRSLHLIGRGIWQEVLDPTTVNRLEFAVDPMPGFVDRNAAAPPEFTLATDSLTSVTLDQSADGKTWTNVPVVALEGGRYRTRDLAVGGAALTSFRIAASDAAGNTLVHTFQLPRGTAYAPPDSDVTPPTTVITSPQSGAAVVGVAPVTAIASDDRGIARVDLVVDGEPVESASSAPYMFAWNSASVSPGVHQLTTRAYDGAENVTESAPVSVTTIDENLAVTLTAPADGAHVGRAVMIRASTTNDDAIVSVTFFDGDTTIGTSTVSPFTTPWNPSAGAHRLTARAIDRAGRTLTSRSVNITADISPPRVAISAPLDGATVSNRVTVRAAASDDTAIARVDFFLDGDRLLGSRTQAPYAIAWDTTATPQGSHTVSAVAIDTADNATSAARAVVVKDVTAPTVAITLPVDGAPVTAGTTQTIAATASDIDGIQRVTFYVSGRAACVSTTAPYTCEWVVPSERGKTYKVQVKAVDTAMNVAASASVSVTAN